MRRSRAFQPRTLNILNFRGNVCVEMPGYKSKVLEQLFGTPRAEVWDLALATKGWLS